MLAEHKAAWVTAFAESDAVSQATDGGGRGLPRDLVQMPHPDISKTLGQAIQNEPCMNAQDLSGWGGTLFLPITLFASFACLVKI